MTILSLRSKHPLSTIEMTTDTHAKHAARFKFMVDLQKTDVPVHLVIADRQPGPERSKAKKPRVETTRSS